MPATTLRLQVPDDYLLYRDCCSYGYFLLHPNHWDVKTRTFTRVLSIGVAKSPLPPQAISIQITQKANAGSALSVRVHGLETRDTKARALAYEQIRAQITRMLRLDESAQTIAAFHARDPRWKESGRGRFFRSPTLFEDVVKTVTSCNVQWPGTIQMNKRLCEVVGEVVGTRVTLAAKPSRAKKKAQDADAPAHATPRAFPLAPQLARTRPATLRARCRVGYRDQRIVELSRLFARSPARGGVDQAALENPMTPDDTVWEMLLDLPGVGPYAAANIMQLLGRYARLPLDTESVRHGRNILGYTGTSRQIMKRVHAHYAPFGPDAFRSYWLELWDFYERKAGTAWTWDRDSTGKVFTAALLK